MGNPRRALWRALDALWLAVLAVYVLAGVDDVPFHGDESSLIAMSHDYYYLVQKRDIGPVLYDSHPADPMDQELRLINGTVGKMAMGFAWDMAGLTAADLNAPWLWGADWEYNVRTGHVPGERLLHAARLSSAVLTAISVIAVFAIAWIAGGRPAAWAAALIYASDPVVLLNGRRAMMEGAHLAFSTLTVLAALWVVREQGRPPKPRRRRLVGLTALFGVTGGLAIASKHPALIVVAAGFVAIASEPLIRRKPSPLNWRRVLRWCGAGVLVLLTFLTLNSAWWSDPLHVPGRVLELRSSLLDQQVAGYGGYKGLGERLEGLARQAFGVELQYYEAPGWNEWVAGEIAQYEESWLAGRSEGLAWALALGGAVVVGMWQLGRRWREGQVWTILLWAGITAVALFIATPLEWQRYYLPLHPPLAVLAGCGVGALGTGIARRWWREDSRDPDRAR
ncbi:MAG: phospholipid carrier-dependent glycosyltransferase [Anaerolineae bacterium]|nr:phospholipid carrier-dependent glycosyltransferase [Anaerolineae bacterium]